MLDLVLVHSFPHDARIWEGQVAALAPVARVHTPDLPGFGRSPEAPAPTIEAMADALDGWIRARGLQRFVLGGMSMGGYVSLAWWRKHGAAGRATGLVLVDTRPDPDSEEGRKGREDAARLVREQGVAPLVEKLMPKLFSPAAAAEPVSFVRRMMESQRPETVIAALLAMRDRADSRPLLPEIRVPTLVVSGEADVLAPPEVMRSMAEAIPGARFVSLPGTGHLSNQENPKAFDPVLRSFLEEVSRRGSAA